MGATGHIITMTMVIMYSAAMSKVRKQCFELFWFSHHLFVVFFGILLIHGTPSSLQPNQFGRGLFSLGLRTAQSGSSVLSVGTLVQRLLPSSSTRRRLSSCSCASRRRRLLPDSTSLCAARPLRRTSGTPLR